MCIEGERYTYVTIIQQYAKLHCIRPSSSASCSAWCAAAGCGCPGYYSLLSPIIVYDNNDLITYCNSNISHTYLPIVVDYTNILVLIVYNRHRGAAPESLIGDRRAGSRGVRTSH